MGNIFDIASFLFELCIKTDLLSTMKLAFNIWDYSQNVGEKL